VESDHEDVNDRVDEAKHPDAPVGSEEDGCGFGCHELLGHAYPKEHERSHAGGGNGTLEDRSCHNTVIGEYNPPCDA